MMDKPLYLYNARLIDGSGQPVPETPYALLVEGSRIQRVAPQAGMPCPDGAVRVDLEGKTLMPGLIDCHDHLANLEGTMVQRAATPAHFGDFQNG